MSAPDEPVRPGQEGSLGRPVDAGSADTPVTSTNATEQAVPPAAPMAGPDARGMHEQADITTPVAAPDDATGATTEVAGDDDEASGAASSPEPDDAGEPTRPDAGEPAAGPSQDVDGQPAGGVTALPLRMILESILMVVDQPVDEVSLAQVVERPRHEVAEALRALATEYDEQRRGFDLRCVAGGWRLYTREDCAPFVERFVLEGQQARLTQAALETLAVVAYRQPVSRGRVAAVRGVNVDGVMRTLVARGLVEEAGHEPESGAVLYRTTGYFLERLGLDSLADLPPLAPFLPEIETLEAETDQDSTGA